MRKLKEEAVGLMVWPKDAEDERESVATTMELTERHDGELEFLIENMPRVVKGDDLFIRIRQSDLRRMLK